MQRDLYLVRHAKSDRSISGQRDFDRGLNSRGSNDAPRMGRLIFEKGVKPDLILCSPALRTKLTCEYFGEQMGFTDEVVKYEEDLYEASLRILLRMINELSPEYFQVMIFGHNPGFTYLAEYLTKKEIGNIPTCGVVHIRFEELEWAAVSGGVGQLVSHEFPKKEETE